MTAAQMLDPVCDMVVHIAGAFEQGLALERPEREYAFCSAGCLTKLAKAPHQCIAKVDAWLATQSRGEHASDMCETAEGRQAGHP